MYFVVVVSFKAWERCHIPRLSKRTRRPPSSHRVPSSSSYLNRLVAIVYVRSPLCCRSWHIAPLTHSHNGLWWYPSVRWSKVPVKYEIENLDNAIFFFISSTFCRFHAVFLFITLRLAGCLDASDTSLTIVAFVASSFFFLRIVLSSKRS